MSGKRYYIAEGETREKLAAFKAAREAALNACRGLRDELGAARFSTMGGFGTRLHGFTFDDDATADTTRLRKDKHGHWVPRTQSKAGRELKARMESIHIPDGMDLAEILHLKTIADAVWVTPGIAFPGDDYLLTVAESSGEPKGCRRISDLEAEALLAEEAAPVA